MIRAKNYYQHAEQYFRSMSTDRGAVYARWHANQQWDYERGRQWARLVPAGAALKRGGVITPEAVAWARRVFKDIF